MYYIYQLGLPIYDLEGQPHYLIIVDDDWKYPKENDPDNEVITEIIKISDWFDKVEKGDLDAWKCACLSKKYIIKEYVKLLLKTDPVQLRANINSQSFITKGLLEDCKHTPKETLFELIANTIFARQIVENHKIINFLEPLKYYYFLKDGMSKDEFEKVYNPIFQEFKELTQGVWVKHIKDRVK